MPIGGGEFVALAVLALIILGPDKLPGYAADAARFLRRLRELGSDARADVRRELGPEFDNISLTDLNPRALVRKHLLEPIEIESLDDLLEDKPAARRGPGTPPSSATSTTPPHYDPDAT